MEPYGIFAEQMDAMVESTSGSVIVLGAIIAYFIVAYIFSFFVTRYIFRKLLPHIPIWLQGGVKGLRFFCFFVIFLLWWVIAMALGLHPNAGIFPMILALPVTLPFAYLANLIPHNDGAHAIFGFFAVCFLYIILGMLIEFFRHGKKGRH